MKWILENSQIVIFVVVALIYWLKEFVEKKMAGRQERESIPDSGDTSYAEEYDESAVESRIPPPLPEPESDARHGKAGGRRKPVTRERRLRKVKAITKATTTGGAAATSAALAAKGTKMPAAVASVSLRKRLRRPAEIRHGIVMREILGPPVGLR